MKERRKLWYKHKVIIHNKSAWYNSLLKISHGSPYTLLHLCHACTYISMCMYICHASARECVTAYIWEHECDHVCVCANVCACLCASVCRCAWMSVLATAHAWALMHESSYTSERAWICMYGCAYTRARARVCMYESAFARVRKCARVSKCARVCACASVRVRECGCTSVFTNRRARVWVYDCVCPSVRSKCSCVSEWECVRKYATGCAYIHARVCGCLRMCINLYSYVSVHMRVRVHLRGCSNDECVWAHECKCATVVCDCSYMCVRTCILVWANASATAYGRVGPSCVWSCIAVK